VKKQFSDLIIEVTRACNLCCEHCLRGDAEEKTISNKTIDLLLNQTEYISSLTFTGGEPTLEPDTIIYIIDQIMEKSIPVGNFYIVTNGTVFHKELFFKLIEFYWYCDDMDESNDFSAGGLSVSIDPYHYNTSEDDLENIHKWKSLVFYKDYKENSHEYSLIDEGYANQNGIGNRALELKEAKFETEIEGTCIYFEELVYLNVNGEIVNDCDMSYETQEEHILGTLQDDDYYTLTDNE
jgi:organic radical activating enzyme